MKVLYTAHASSVGGRAGHVETDDKRLSFDLTPSTSKTGTNPEQLFACGYSACFGSAVDAVLKKEGLSSHPTVEAAVDLKQADDGYHLGVTLKVTLPGLTQEQAEKVVQGAHAMCPYSRATRGNIDVQLTVNNSPLQQTA